LDFDLPQVLEAFNDCLGNAVATRAHRKDETKGWKLTQAELKQRLLMDVGKQPSLSTSSPYYRRLGL
jgi:hypothetical protein